MRQMLVLSNLDATVAIALTVVISASSVAGQPALKQTPQNKAPCEGLHVYGFPIESKDVPRGLADFVQNGLVCFEYVARSVRELAL